MAQRLQTYRVEAYNSAKQSENKMHDDSVARRFGFSGGLVPGVDVMAYIMHVPITRWGRDFLSRGLIETRFIKPVYDGETAEVEATEHEGVLTIELFSRGELCATGTASLPVSAPAFSLDDYLAVPAVPERHPVGPATFELGKWLGTTPRRWVGQSAADYLAEIRETDALFAHDGLGHPGLLQRVMNRVLVDNTILGPWIHVGSRMQLLAPSRSGDEITARAKVIANYEKKGHRFVELDALVVANGSTPIAHCHHTAIYQPREQAAA
jgi:acyl dehydratase